MQMPEDIFKTVTLKRYAAGDYVDGVWTEGTESAATITAYIEPLTRVAMTNKFTTLDEGKIQNGGILIITDEELNVVSVPDKQSPDRITWRGEDWEIIGKDDFEFTTLEEAHHEYAGVRVTQ